MVLRGVFAGAFLAVYAGNGVEGFTMPAGVVMNVDNAHSLPATMCVSSMPTRTELGQEAVPPVGVFYAAPEEKVMRDCQPFFETGGQNQEESIQQLRRLARTSNRRIEALEQAQDVFDGLVQAYTMAGESTTPVEIYNLLLEALAYSRVDDRAERAMNLLEEMEDGSNKVAASPDLESYLNVIDTWAMRQDPEMAEEILQRLKERYDATGDGAVKPTADAYNKLIKAYGVVEDMEKVDEIFQCLRDGVYGDDLKANYKSWLQTMKAYTSMNETDKVKKLFRDMLQAYRQGQAALRPKTDAYNVLIRALGKDREFAERAEDVMFEMIKQYRAGDDNIRPNGETFRNVLVAMQRRSRITSAKIEQILQIQEGLYATTKCDDLKLDGQVYTAALRCLPRCHDSMKAFRARRVLDNLKALEDGSEYVSGSCYYQLLSACAHAKGPPEAREDVFRIASDALVDLKETLNRDPDSGCVGMYIKACRNLIAGQAKRDEVVEKVFLQCSQDGMVDNFVLREFARASSQGLQLQVLGGFLEDDVRIPLEWQENVHKRR